MWPAGALLLTSQDGTCSAADWMKSQRIPRDNEGTGALDDDDASG
jgi:hypothetical protein